MCRRGGLIFLARDHSSYSVGVSLAKVRLTPMLFDNAETMMFSEQISFILPPHSRSFPLPNVPTPSITHSHLFPLIHVRILIPHPHTHAHTHAHTHTRTHAHTHNKHTRHTHARTHTHAHTHKHTHEHTHAHTHKHTHTNVVSRADIYSLFSWCSQS